MSMSSLLELIPSSVVNMSLYILVAFDFLDAESMQMVQVRLISH